MAPVGGSKKRRKKSKHMLTQIYTESKTLHTGTDAHAQDLRGAALHKGPSRPETPRILKRVSGTLI